MKTHGLLQVLAIMLLGSMTSYGQEIDADVPGDNFSLEGALELFKKSASPEEFEKLLNSPDSKVNNLDLNGDGYIDYVRVHDRYEGNVHAFILQAVISEGEMQDIAVIELEKLSNGKAVLQIVGNEDIYGIETIIEPTREVRTYAGTRSTPTVVNVWTWPSVRYVYSPYYAGWVSPWGWHHRPLWWHTWRPVAYVHYHPIWRPYHPHYAVCHTRRVVYAHRIYSPYRTRSVVVRDRHREQITRYRSSHHDNYRNGRTRDDDRRSYANQNVNRDRTSVASRRADADVNRRGRVAPQGETQTSPSRSISRERSSQTNLQRNSTEFRKENRTVERTPEISKPVKPSAENGKLSRTPNVQRPTTPARSVQPDVQRNNSELRRESPPMKRSEAIQNNRETRPQTTRPDANTYRSPAAPKVQRSVPAERSGAAKESRSRERVRQ